MSITKLPSRPCARRLRPANGWLGTAFAFAVLLLGALPLQAQAQEDTVCGPDVKNYIVNTLAQYEQADPEKKQAAEDELFKQFSYCAQDAAKILPTDPIYTAARQCGAKVSILGSLYFEEMSCCGYDPQRRQFACPVKIKKSGGFGPAAVPGSREYVLHCVEDGNGTLLPVGYDSVHLANSAFQPSWQFAVIAAAVTNLHTVQPLNQQPRRARSILSWNKRPTGCNFQPTWGIGLDYTIRLDQ